MHELLWQLEGVTCAGDDRPRLSAIDVDIPRGRTAVLGPSGAGKSTLLNLLVNFERPTSGVVNHHLPRKDVAFDCPVYWSPAGGGLWAHLSVVQHLTAVMSPGEDRMRSRDDRAAALLDAFELSDRSDARPAALSAGEAARLSVARAIAANPAVLVLDEPLAHVDPARVPRFWAVIREHLDRTGANLVFATHDPGVVLAEAGRAICLQQGERIYAGSVNALYHAPPTEAAARMLGETNWLDRATAEQWLTDPGSAALNGEPRSVRPESLEVTPDDSSPVAVDAVTFRGATCAITLRREDRRGEKHDVVCRPTATLPRPGQRVRVRVLTMLLLMMLTALPGCGDGDAENTLDAQWSTTIALPRDGIQLPAPRGVHAGASGQVYVLDDIGRLLIYDEDGELLRQWFMPETDIGRPEGVYELADGRIVVADTHYSRLVFFDQQGEVLEMFGTMGEAPGDFIYPVALTADDAGNLYVVEYGSNDRVTKLSPDLEVLAVFGSFGTTRGAFQRPSGIAWHDGRLYIADAINSRVQVFEDDGTFVGVLGGAETGPELEFPYDLSIGPDGLLYVVEYKSGRVTALSLDGEVVGRLGETGRGENQFATPWCLTVDHRGRIWVADTGNRRLVELVP